MIIRELCALFCSKNIASYIIDSQNKRVCAPNFLCYTKLNNLLFDNYFYVFFCLAPLLSYYYP